jgi:outer membrane protein OmpA-like peptidoglycan-associated protein
MKTFIRILNITIAPFLLGLGFIIITAFMRGELHERVPETPLNGTLVISPKHENEYSKLQIDHPPSQEAELRVIRTDSINFRIGKADLETSSIPTLQEILETIRKDPNILVVIEGHTDSTGPAEFNMNLSKQRADMVSSWLIENGISSKRIITEWYGNTKPISENSTVEGRWKNRRVDIILLNIES